jgi:hypothetical protein
MWGGIVAFNLWRMSAGLRFMVRLKRTSHPLAVSHQDRLRLWTSVRGSGRRPDLRVSAEATTPCALGLGRPVILLPEALASTLPDRELDLIVMHEHAHLARYDDWLRMLECALAAVVGVHPAVQLIARRIDLEREAACDDRVVLRTGDARLYAQCLATVAGLSQRINRAAMAVAPHAIRSRTVLAARVTRLLDRHANRTARLVPSAAVVSFATLALAVFAAGHLPSLVVIGHVSEDILAPLAVRSITPAGFGQIMPGTAPAIERQRMHSPTVSLDGVITLVQVAMPSVPQPAPIDVKIDSSATSPSPPASPPIESRAIEPTLTAHSFGWRTDNHQESADSGTDWAGSLAAGGVAAGQDAKRIGLAVGSSSRRAGESIGRFFTRGGKSVAGK